MLVFAYAHGNHPPVRRPWLCKLYQLCQGEKPGWISYTMWASGICWWAELILYSLLSNARCLWACCATELYPARGWRAPSVCAVWRASAQSALLLTSRPRVPQPVQAALEGRSTALYGVTGLSERHSVLFPTAGFGTGDRRYRHSSSTRWAACWAAVSSARLYLFWCSLSAIRLNLAINAAGRLCAHQPSAVCRVFRKVL